MNTTQGLRVALLSGLVSLPAAAFEIAVSPLTSFGGGDGWLAPGEGGYGFLGTGNNERGLAYGNGQLYLVSRAGGVNVRRLNPITGADLGGLDVTGIAGGTFAANMVAVAGDGVVYVGNLATGGGNFKVYRWANDAAAPTVAYDGNPGGAPRLGDSFDVLGSGDATWVAASGSTTSGFALINPSAGTGSLVSVAGASTGDFRLGMTFVDGDTVIGTQGGGSPFRVVDIVDGTTGNLIASPATTSSSERLITYEVINGYALFATVDTANAAVRLYDATDLANPSLLATVNNTSGTLTGNGNGVGSVVFGPVFGNAATLYAMSANQGIQAFVVTVPEPGVLPLSLLGLGLLLARRRRGTSAC